MGFMESPLVLSDLLTRHEPKTRKSLQINRCLFGFMGRIVMHANVLWGHEPVEGIRSPATA